MLYYDFDKICAGEIFDESGSGNNGMSRGSVVVEAGYNEDNGVDLSDGFIQLDGKNFKVDNNLTCIVLVYSILKLSLDTVFHCNIKHFETPVKSPQ